MGEVGVTAVLQLCCACCCAGREGGGEAGIRGRSACCNCASRVWLYCICMYHRWARPGQAIGLRFFSLGTLFYGSAPGEHQCIMRLCYAYSTREDLVFTPPLPLTRDNINAPARWRTSPIQANRLDTSASLRLSSTHPLSFPSDGISGYSYPLPAATQGNVLWQPSVPIPPVGGWLMKFLTARMTHEEWPTQDQNSWEPKTTLQN